LEKAIALFHARGGAIYLKRSSSTPLWERVVASGASSPLLLAENHPIVAPLRGGATEAVKEKLLWDIRSKPSTEDNIQRRDQLLSWTYAVTLPLIENGHLLGFLALEEKVSRAMYNEEDLGMLRQIGRPAAMILDHTLKTDDLKHNVLVKKKHDDMVMMGMVATEMAHELSRPLTHIMNTGSRLEPIISESAREGLAKIEQAAQRASDILDSFVMLSPENDLARETILMGHLMDEAIKALGLDEDSSITIERHYDASLKVRGHAGQVTQIYTNILQNAWQAMPTGGRLRIMTQSDTSGSIATEVIRLEDTGGGIPSHMLARVFDLFFTTKKDKGGRGVGLALSRAMVERHGGRMTIESPIENGRGTRVSIRFPLETGDTHAK
jgi:signal transduction histidine kinase